MRIRTITQRVMRWRFLIVIFDRWNDKLWVASHNILRDYTGVVGSMLDTHALTKALPLQIADERLVTAQASYQKVVQTFLLRMAMAFTAKALAFAGILF